MDRIRQKGKKSSTKKTRDFWRYVKKYYPFYLLLIPGLFYFILFHYVPMYGILLAFKDFNMRAGIMASSWAGLEHFQNAFSTAGFWRAFRNSLIINLYKLFWGFPVPIILALLINEIRHVMVKKTIQTVLYLPHFISWVVYAGMIRLFLSPSEGVVNSFIKDLGGTRIPFLQIPEYFRTILVSSGILKDMGWGSIIYLASITSIDQQLYEAAYIDGANRWQRMWHITLPGISGTIVVLLILRMGRIMNNGFEQVLLLYNDLVMKVGDVLETYTYRLGLQQGRFSYATAVGLFKSLIGLVMIVMTNYISKKISDKNLF